MGPTRERSIGCFQHSDPSWRVRIELPDATRVVADVLPGDLIYTRRPGGYQRLVAAAGDTWRHVGLAAVVAGVIWIIEVGPHGYQGRPLSTAMRTYDSVAVQRLRPCSDRCDLLLSHIVGLRMNSPTDFHSRSELAAIGLLSFTRQFTTLWRPCRALRTHFYLRLLGREGFDTRSICSTPIAKALEALCDQHQVSVDLCSPKREKATSRCKGAVQLAMPDDIWRALEGTAEQFWLKKDGQDTITEIIDLRPDREEVSNMSLGV